VKGLINTGIQGELSMASFIGTIDEFIKYVNPRAKNVVNSITKNYKKEKGKCEHCGTTQETLEAAHLTGRERPKIIEEILSNFKNGEVITVDLEVFENLFLEAHKPLNEIILVLCHSCHINYESNKNLKLAALDDTNTTDNRQLMTNSQITDTLREIVPTLNNAQLLELQDPNYCNETFLINYIVIKPIPIHSTQEQIRMEAQINGYNRWSTQRPIIRDNECFLVTTQWTDRHRINFENWLKVLND
jgi:protein-arginine kinase activator protein McsA